MTPLHKPLSARFRKGFVSSGLVACAGAVLGLCTSGCNGGRTPGKTTGAGTPETPEAVVEGQLSSGTSPTPKPPAAESPDPVADDEAPERPPTTRLREVVSEEAIGIVREATAGQAASVRIIGVETAAEQTLTSDDTLVGYPVRGEMLSLEPDTLRALADLLLQDASYEWGGARRRCANRTAKGFRLTRGDERVELWLGVECRQLLWGWRQDGEVFRSHVYVLSDTAGHLVRLASAGD